VKKNNNKQSAMVKHNKILLDVDIKSKKVPSSKGHGFKELIHNVKLDIREGALVALLGGSGAGKSTLMNCINGMDINGVSGIVLFNNENLYENFDRLKFLIGSVPQSNVFHDMLTVEEEFREAAIMKLPCDMTKNEINRRVDETIHLLGLDLVRKSKNCKLSGGEQKRVNIGIDLVADRKLLCLDEPDAGLDPKRKTELFMILKNLAHSHDKCVIAIIHDVSDIELFDQVIMMVKTDNVGRLAFSGSPSEAKNYFGVELKDVYSLIEENPQKYLW
jgi:ABC-type multidrug transport system ATPase subunit